MSVTERPVVTVAVAALLLGIEVDAVHALVEQGELESVASVNGAVDVCMASLDAYDDA